MNRIDELLKEYKGIRKNSLENLKVLANDFSSNKLLMPPIYYGSKIESITLWVNILEQEVVKKSEEIKVLQEKIGIISTAKKEQEIDI